LGATSEAIDSRPAVQRGRAVLAEKVRATPITAEEREVMFGKKQFETRRADVKFDRWRFEILALGATSAGEDPYRGWRLYPL